MSIEANKTVVRRFMDEIVNRRNPAAAPEICAANEAWHGAGIGEIIGLEHLSRTLGAFIHAFPDLTCSVEDLFGDGDYVATRWLATGTHRGELMGQPPTGRPVEFDGISIFRVENGKIAEEWWHGNLAGLMQQIGPAPAAATRRREA